MWITFQFTKQNDIPPQIIQYNNKNENPDFIEQTIIMEGQLKGYDNRY